MADRGQAHWAGQLMGIKGCFGDELMIISCRSQNKANSFYTLKHYYL